MENVVELKSSAKPKKIIYWAAAIADENGDLFSHRVEYELKEGEDANAIIHSMFLRGGIGGAGDGGLIPWPPALIKVI